MADVDKGGGFSLRLPKGLITRIATTLDDTDPPSIPAPSAATASKQRRVLAALARAAYASAVSTRDPEIVEFITQVVAIDTQWTLVENDDGKNDLLLQQKLESVVGTLVALTGLYK